MAEVDFWLVSGIFLFFPTFCLSLGSGVSWFFSVGSVGNLSLNTLTDYRTSSEVNGPPRRPSSADLRK